MDFSLIEKHPWGTAGIVAGGGILLFLMMRRSSAPAATAPASYTSSGVDPATAQLAAQAAAQAAQSQTYIQGLNIQGATQISLAQIGADVARYQTTAGVDVTDHQTAAQLELGLGTLGAQVETTRIQAGLQSDYIKAIVAAFTGNQGPAVSPAPISTPTGGYYPTQQIAPLQPATYAPPIYNTPSYTGAVNPGTIAPGAAPLPGGAQLTPDFYVAGCDPRDSACVMGNTNRQIDWENSTITNQRTNNRNQCLANAELSRGFPNYASLVSACG